ncbi:MAG: hemerythrin domain-containing protein [Gammaproteobacteria bacterium]|nr:hemerythrin domain-containing protein [Gammaproteobacteria bacterium]MDH5239332.1 hemerythrin domain-containing protein [Gammaproteobacteria bacterium]MDH5260627.1 hemerythrin domain-containing protein [Gammaproteobacteria bacterium]MDH5584806.1 hemerythrin domain-containing protein [Gammaproteobacteria bacterium]
MKSTNQLILSELRDDHRNMAIILDLLEETAATTKAGNDPDFLLIEEIMRYMMVYADAVHHPKEDLIFAELQTHRPDLAEGLDDVPEDHWLIAALGTRLRSDVDAIIAGAAVRREQLIGDIKQYVKRLRSHMHWEEDDLFPRVDKMIAEDPHGIDVGDSLRIKDPVFEPEIESAFRRVMASLQDR